MPTNAKLIGGGIFFLVVLVVLLLINPLVQIGAGERGVVLTWGAVSDRVLDEGMHWRTPVAQKIKSLDVTVQKYVSSADAASKDLQSVDAEIALNYHLDPLRVNDIWQQFRGRELQDLIDPAIEESVKSGMAEFTAEELITQRVAVKDHITNGIKTRIEKYGFLVDAVSIVNFQFSQSFDAAIEQKVTAEQDALAEENRLEQVKFKAEQVVVAAKAEAEAIRIQAQAINSQGGADYVQLQAIAAWDGKLPTQMIPNATLPILNLR